jgi:hypothetical protein
MGQSRNLELELLAILNKATISGLDELEGSGE